MMAHVLCLMSLHIGLRVPGIACIKMPPGIVNGPLEDCELHSVPKEIYHCDLALIW